MVKKKQNYAKNNKLPACKICNRTANLLGKKCGGITIRKYTGIASALDINKISASYSTEYQMEPNA